jgi:hypothetical protein
MDRWFIFGSLVLLAVAVGMALGVFLPLHAVGEMFHDL